MTDYTPRGGLCDGEIEFNERLAETIRNYWAKRGRVVRTKIISGGHSNEYRKAVGGIKSDLSLGVEE